MSIKLKKVILRLAQFGPPLQVECQIVNDADLVHEAVRAFAKHAPCTVHAYEAEGEMFLHGRVQLTVEGRLVP